MSYSLTDFLSEQLAKVPPDIVLIIVCALILSFFVIGVYQLIIVSKFSFRLKKEAKIIKGSQELSFSEISAELFEIKLLIEEFQEMLTDKGQNVENCEVILSDENIFRSLKVNEAALEHFPGIFTALGIVGTFIGILFVLVPITSELGQSDQLVDRLLQGAGIAFLTSIIGICFSLLFLISERKIIGNFKRQLYEFRMAINIKLPRVTSEGILIEISESIKSSIRYDLLEIKDAMQTMADDIGTAVSKRIAETLNSVSKVLDNSISVANNSSQEIVSKVMGSIDGTLDKFSDNLEKMEKSSSTQSEILEQFDTSVESTTRLAEKLEKLLPSLIEITKDLEATSIRLEKIPETLKSLTDLQEDFIKVVTQHIELMNNNWKNERERLTGLIEEMRKQFTAFEDGIANGLQTTMSKFDDELSRAGTYVATWLDRLNEDVNNFTKQVTTFNGVVQNNSSNLQKTINNYAKVLLKHSSVFETNLEAISSNLKADFQEIENGIRQLPPEISKAVGGIEQIYKTASEQLPQILSAHMQTIVEEMDKTTRKGFRLFRR